MKAFIISVCLIAITICLISFNAFYFNSTIKEIKHLLYLLPSNPTISDNEDYALEILSRLESMIYKYGDYYQYFITNEELRMLFSSILECGEYYRAGDFPSYLATLRQAKECVMIVELNETVSLKNVL